SVRWRIKRRPLNVRIVIRTPHPDGSDGNDAILVVTGRIGHSPGEYHGGESLLQFAHSAAGALSAIGRISATGRSTVWRGAAVERYARIETTISEFDFCRNGIQLFTGFSAACGASGGARRMDGFRRVRADGIGVSRDSV